MGKCQTKMSNTLLESLIIIKTSLPNNFLVSDIQHSTSNPSLSPCFSKSESAVNNIQYSSLNQSMRQPVDQDIRQRKSTQSMSQRFARSDSAAYNKGYKASYFI